MNFKFQISNLKSREAAAFTLIEMLVVISIIGLLAAVGLPALKGFGKSNAIVAADRQLLDDLAAARQLAMAQHTTVYMIFASPSLTNLTWSSLTAAQQQQATNVLVHQYASYALYADRGVGEQPGHTSPRYLTRWKPMPEGVFIATGKFTNGTPGRVNGVWQFEKKNFPFPFVTNASPSLPYLGFNYLGQLLNARDNGTEIIPLERGSIMYFGLQQANVKDRFSPDVIETPPGNAFNSMSNAVVVDGLTGRARVEKWEIQ